MSSENAESLRGSLAFRVGALIFATLFIFVALLFLTVHYMMSVSLEKRDHELIRTRLREVMSLYESGGAASVSASMTKNLLKEDLKFLVRGVGPDGKTLFMRPPLHSENYRLEQLEQGTAPHISANGGTQETWYFLEDSADEDSLEILSVKLPNGETLQVGRGTDDRDDRLEQLRAVFLLSCIPMFAFGVLGSFLVSRQVARPIRNLIRTVRDVNAGHIQARVPPFVSKGELGQLTVLFNGMLGRMDNLMRAMRGTVDHVAHDIRTPLTSLRGAAETALKSEEDLPLYREALIQCVESSERILRLVEAVMDVSEAETGVIALKREPIEAGPLFEQALDLYRLVAEEKQIAVEASSELTRPLALDIGQMRRVLANLLDNSVKYTQAGGQVALHAYQEGEWSVLSVTDNGMGITEQDLPRIWLRLYRGDESRSQRGLGLGLTLVKAIVEAHGGKVRAESHLGQGTKILIYLPA